MMDKTTALATAVAELAAEDPSLALGCLATAIISIAEGGLKAGGHDPHQKLTIQDQGGGRSITIHAKGVQEKD
ncbi:hypothetical protein KUW19_00040 [Ferrimonas balearica]|uniref:hypothetical protein n=1 Tax=Ferrimonas balearica TaxID=44012 RepID=UPI001C9378E7|nr:hypothetical protein [Ferrimonas balearica]MBY6104870.1 hypothetical protein [Ferrimonas balearica]